MTEKIFRVNKRATTRRNQKRIEIRQQKQKVKGSQSAKRNMDVENGISQHTQKVDRAETEVRKWLSAQQEQGPDPILFCEK